VAQQAGTICGSPNLAIGVFFQAENAEPTNAGNAFVSAHFIGGGIVAEDCRGHETQPKAAFRIFMNMPNHLFFGSRKNLPSSGSRATQTFIGCNPKLTAAAAVDIPDSVTGKALRPGP
jgi:hypothetical protein